MNNEIVDYDEPMMSGTYVDDNVSPVSIEELLVSTEALEKLTAIGKGTPSSYKSITNVDEAKKLVESCECRKKVK